MEGLPDHRPVCGLPLPEGLRQADRLPEPIFTPATKAQHGHDENIELAAVSVGWEPRPPPSCSA